MSAIVEPALVVEAERVDDEDVALPFAKRIAHPGGRTLGRVIAPVGEDLAEVGEALEQDHHQPGCLHNLPRIARDEHRVGYGVRQAASGRTIATLRVLTLLEDRRAGRRERGGETGALR